MFFAWRQISSTGSPTACVPEALKPRSRSVRMPSSRIAWVRFFSSSSSSSGTKPSVRKRLGGMLATASRHVSAPRKPARSAHSRSARLPSCEPLYASRIFLYFMESPPPRPIIATARGYNKRPSMVDFSGSDLTAGVVGTGTMGRGIAQVLAQCGARTLVYDAQPGAAAKARQAIGEALARMAEKGRLADPEAVLARIEIVPALESLAPCRLVVEAIVEDLAAKRTLFSGLEKIVQEKCVLASNTSSLSVTEMAAACKRPGRVAG